jgi:hypothetical protein
MPCTHGNLGDHGQNQRLRGSVVALAVGLGLSVWMLGAGIGAPLRLLLFLPFFAAAFGAYQGLFRTCTKAARDGVRLADHGEEVVVDPAERAQMRRDGRKIVVSSLATAAAATAMMVLLP